MLIDTNEVLSKLLERYPDSIPKQKVTEYELGTLVGQQEVILYLSSFFKQLEKPKKDKK